MDGEEKGAGRSLATPGPMKILPVTKDHFAAILDLNEEFVEVLAPLTREGIGGDGSDNE